MLALPQARFVIYSALFGPRREPPILDAPLPEGWEAYLFTDRDAAPAGWSLRSPHWHHDDPCRQARWHKLNPEALFPRAEISIWLDANLSLVADPWLLVSRLGQCDLATFKHPVRDCVYQEADACISLGKDEPKLITEQIERYRMRGLPSHTGLAETNCLVRRHTLRMQSFNQFWWWHLARGSRRDQLGFGYLTHRIHFHYSLLPGHGFDSPWFLAKPH